MAITLNGTTGITTPKLDALDLELGSKNVVERGSNANGEYVRFADGTQICTQRVGVHSATRVTWTLPASFVNIDYQCPFVGEANTDGLDITVTVRVRATTSVDYQSNGPSTSHAVQKTAVGRWF